MICSKVWIFWECEIIWLSFLQRVQPIIASLLLFVLPLYYRFQYGSLVNLFLLINASIPKLDILRECFVVSEKVGYFHQQECSVDASLSG
ncbi:unnamed protein product [Coffea canephora]|uniref:DH200=94 genomic scaffold, scaffold_230 n=1 Tax=Coffea canephora TaxID=49390 RepID=A0A068VCT7_COFCA|nr:unnamed protein product [Coffea canephora]